MNYKMIIQYDGSRYDGWQRQGNTHETIQEKIEETILKMTGYVVELSASGRTDAGVHALGQVANFKTNEIIKEDEFLKDLNRYLPKDIRIVCVERVGERFFARLNARRKTYLYRIDNSRFGSVFDRKYAMRFSEKLDVEKMKTAAAYLVGEHDFKSFCNKKNMKKSTVRIIYSIDIICMGDEEDRIIEIEYTGNGFLYNMVRILTGTLIDVGRGKIEPEKIPQIIDEKDRGAAGFTAAPEGLFLKKVEYS